MIEPTQDPIDNGWFVSSRGVIYGLVDRSPTEVEPTEEEQPAVQGLAPGYYTQDQMVAIVKGASAKRATP